ncbi:MAG: hypothetical protein ACHQIM_12960 [Sphingobacteriales bacterium]
MNNKLLNLVLLLSMPLSIVAFGKSSNVKTQINTNTTKAIPKSVDGLYKFTGKLDGKIPVFLWFVVKDSVLKGEVTYLRTKKRLPITIIGTIIRGERFDQNADKTIVDFITIYEFNKNGYVTGTYEGEFNAKTLSGIWSAPGSEKELKYKLMRKDTSLNHIDTILTPISINGEYLYHFGEQGSSGGIDIKERSPGEFLVDINCTTPSPQNNVADLETFKAHMVNNTIIYKIPNEDCKFRIRVFNNFIVINYVGKSWNCGFGLNAGVDGVFIKTSEVAKLK